ncbi:hypothetical protein CDAR_471531 [Caerostris darwini]|uniref:Uncharacterized protein n=1 Tax=Caerostris darwini TaxID=1538125 RepID=A0AAV4RI26_9ARAC|nr:hypothetical protein CDAR_471531 [Caerostris darwini]
MNLLIKTLNRCTGRRRGMSLSSTNSHAPHPPRVISQKLDPRALIMGNESLRSLPKKSTRILEGGTSLTDETKVILLEKRCAAKSAKKLLLHRSVCCVW